MTIPQFKTRRALRLPAVMAKTGMRRTQIFDAVQRGVFPAPFKVLPGGKAIAWDEAEVDQHLERQMAARDLEVALAPCQSSNFLSKKCRHSTAAKNRGLTSKLSDGSDGAAQTAGPTAKIEPASSEEILNDEIPLK